MAVGGSVGIAVGRSVGTAVGTSVGLGVAVGISVGRGVAVGTSVGRGVLVAVGRGVLVGGMRVLVGRGVRVGGTRVAVGRGVLVARGRGADPLKSKAGAGVLVSRGGRVLVGAIVGWYWIGGALLGGTGRQLPGAIISDCATHAPSTPSTSIFHHRESLLSSFDQPITVRPVPAWNNPTIPRSVPGPTRIRTPLRAAITVQVCTSTFPA